MLNNHMRLPSRLQELMIERLKANQLMGTAPDQQDICPFTVALVDAACCRPNNSTEILEIGTTIGHMAQRINASAPFSTRSAFPAVMMQPDIGDTEKGGGPLSEEAIRNQWDTLLSHMNNAWQPEGVHQVGRGDFYRWLAGQAVDELPHIDVVIRCGNERADYGNLVLNFNLGTSPLRTLPEELWANFDLPFERQDSPRRIEALQRLGHMNSVAIVSRIQNARSPKRRFLPTFDLGRDSSYQSAFELINALHVPDRHVQPSYRGVSTACAAHGEIDGIQSWLTGNWQGVQAEQIDEKKLQAELSGFWLGAILIVEERIDATLILTTGVTREPAADWHQC